MFLVDILQMDIVGPNGCFSFGKLNNKCQSSSAKDRFICISVIAAIVTGLSDNFFKAVSFRSMDTGQVHTWLAELDIGTVPA